jgi:hypothetical protein
MRPPRAAALVLVVALSWGPTVGCTGSDDDATPSTTAATSTTSTTSPPRDHSPLRDRPLPEPVPYASTGSAPPAAPAFEALPGAQAHVGRLGGAVYHYEVPDDWNGTLVMWMHGFEEFRPEARVGPPDFRRYLIGHGMAWAASSFSSTSMIPSLAADETAALWDHVVAEIGRPRWTYVSGFSMGGWATNIAAERYGDRYDGALGLCGAVDVDPGLRTSVDQVVAAAYVAGLDQHDVDTSRDLVTLLDQRVRPALDDPAQRQQVIDLVVGLTGGPRPFAAEGIERELETNWERGRLAIASGLVPPVPEPYALAGPDADAGADFDERAVRFPTNDDGLRSFSSGMDQAGRLAMPLLTMHTTGDGQVPISQAIAMHDLVDASGRADRLVQRVLADPGHCGFTTAEQEQGFEALTDWVERGRRPAGTDLSNPDLTHLDRTFELEPRQVDGETLTVGGTALLDGQPLDADYIGLVVVDDGLVTPCQAALPVVSDGEVDLPAYTATGAAGCLRDRTQIAVWTYVDDRQIFSELVDVRSTADLTAVRFTLSTAHPQADIPSTSGFNGEVFDAEGGRVTTGRVEARIGGHVCGVSSNRNRGSFDGYLIAVLRTGDDGPCPDHATITFTVDGRPAEPSVANDEGRRDPLDLAVP